MKISINRLSDKIVWVVTTILLAFFILFETVTWGRYVFFGVTMLIALMIVVVNNGKIPLKLQAYHGLFALFILFVLVSAVWAWSASAAISKAITLVLIFACSAVLYMYYQDKEDTHALITAVMWSGYIVALYTIFFYGVENFGADVEADRLDNDFANVNNIGMTVALSCVLQFNKLLNKESRWSAVMMIPSTYVIAATQSRTALILLIGGIYASYILKIGNQKGTLKKLLKVIFYTVFFCAGIYFLLKLPTFSGMMERMKSLGNITAESSAGIRQQMIKIGLDYFKQHPIGGIGIGGSYILTERHLGESTYLHNNFVELLSCGGIIGFICYYASYVYLYVNLIKYRKATPEFFAIGFTWLSIMLVAHYGGVEYHTKSSWYQLLIHFLNVECMKRKARGIQYECKRNT